MIRPREGVSSYFFVPINLQSGYISIFIMANWSFRFNLIDMRKTQQILSRFFSKIRKNDDAGNVSRETFLML